MAPSPSVIAARREFETVFGDLAKGKRNWQLVAFGCLALLGVREVAYQRYAAGSRITPYVVEVDALGRAQAFGPAEPLIATDRRVTIAILATFIQNLRIVTPDWVTQADLSQRAYAFVASSAAGFLNSYFSDAANDPRTIGKSLTRTVEVTSVLQVPGTDTWKVQWIETERPRHGGAMPHRAAWEAYLVTTITPPTTTESIDRNPLGLYVTSITWSRLTPPRSDSTRTAF